jgi:hypothetical protein
MFVEIATDKCGNINEQPSQIWSYVLVRLILGLELTHCLILPSHFAINPYPLSVLAYLVVTT